ncbi:MAG: hypothetical protein JWM06_2347 [Actinomycetia bacterium]|nr:hypothetical protein [Actinomycetes bacterium]
MKAVRALGVVCALALLLAEHAGAQTSSDFAGHQRQVFRVVVVRDLSLADLPQLATVGAVGLVVPNAGPRTSAADAFAGMVRGILYNTRLARPHADVVLIRVQKARSFPLTGPAIVIGLPPEHRVANDRRYPVAVIGRGYHGLLSSSLTRVPGLVSIADIARTALQTPHMLRDQKDANGARTLQRLESHIVVSRDSTMATSVLVLGLLVFFALFFPQGTAGALGAALAANLALGWMLAGSTGPRVALVGACTVAGGILAARFLRSGTRLGLALVAVVMAYAATMVVHPEALSLAPMGPELTSRFFGVSNLLETFLLAPALLGAKLLADRYGWLAFAAVALLTLLTIAENQLGSDGGGAIVVGVAFAVLAVGMSGAAWRLVVPALGLAALAVFVLLDLDAATNSPDHLRGALHGGVNGFAHVVANRVPLAYTRMIEQWWLLIPAAAALIIGVAASRSRRTTALGLTMLAALGASLLVNDSPGPVMIAGLAAVLAIEGGLVYRSLTLPVLRRLSPSPTPIPQQS